MNAPLCKNMPHRPTMVCWSVEPSLLFTHPASSPPRNTLPAPGGAHVMSWMSSSWWRILCRIFPFPGNGSGYAWIGKNRAVSDWVIYEIRLFCLDQIMNSQSHETRQNSHHMPVMINIFSCAMCFLGAPLLSIASSRTTRSTFILLSCSQTCMNFSSLYFILTGFEWAFKWCIESWNPSTFGIDINKSSFRHVSFF